MPPIKALIIAMCVSLPVLLFAQQNTTPKPLSEAIIQQKIAQIIKGLSLDDKIGEMTQLSIDMISVGRPYHLKDPHQIDTQRLKNVLLNLRVGSILNSPGHELSKEDWATVINTIQTLATKQKKSRIPVLYGIDAIHGNTYTAGATLFPQQIGISATWNTDLVKQLAQLSAYETRASMIPWNFSPVLDVARSPLWPRIWETFGEDVYLVSTMGTAVLKGYQGENVAGAHQVTATLKHYFGYGAPLSGKDRTPAWIPNHYMREYFLPPFEAAIKNGALTIMVNSGEVNGTPMHMNSYWLTDVLRKELGFKGLVVSDWEDILYLHTRHKVAANYKDAIKMAINAGIDMSMVPTDTLFPRLLKQLVQEKQVSMSRIDEAVSRILYVKFKAGLFDAPVWNTDTYPKFGGAEHAAISYQAAVESITLLKNTHQTLPLSKGKKVVVLGPNAQSINNMNGGWSHTWQGVDTKYNPTDKPTILQAIEQLNGKANTVFIDTDKSDWKTVVQSVDKKASFVLCLGETPYTEKPGDINDLNLDPTQTAIATTLAEFGIKPVLVLTQGRPRIIRTADSLAAAVVHAYLPGNEGGRAIAAVLFGDENPSGKLPYTYPKYPNDLVPYDHKYSETFDTELENNGFTPQYPFGFGLSYTNFAYSDLKVSKAIFNSKDVVEVSVKVTNVGSRAGKEVVQLYTADKVASLTPSVKRLKGFSKILLQPGASTIVQFKLTAADLSFVHTNEKRITEAGEFEIMIDQLITTITYKD
jgi:beta-glucosidase